MDCAESDRLEFSAADVTIRKNGEGADACYVALQSLIRPNHSLEWCHSRCWTIGWRTYMQPFHDYIYPSNVAILSI